MSHSNLISELEKNSFGLSARDRDSIYSILKKYKDITSVILFGSRAKGTFKKGSDIDLAIFTESLSEEIILKLKEDFEESSLPYRVDIVHYPTLTHQELKSHIDRVGVPFYKTI